MNEELFSAAAREKRSKKWESIRAALPQELYAGSVRLLIDLLYAFIEDGHCEELFESDMEILEDRVNLLYQLTQINAPKSLTESLLLVVECEAERLLRLVIVCLELGYTKTL